jgi:DNA polymerase/3'-5' exonuclease PolX
MADVKAKVIEALEILMKREVVQKQFFKMRAYKKVLEELRISKKPITKLTDLDDFPGVGEKIRSKVQEILETGGLVAAEKAKEELQLNAVDALTGVYGIGTVKAKDLIAKGIKTIEALRAELAKDPGLLNEKQKIGVRYYEDILQRIPRAEMRKHEKLLLGSLVEGMRGTVVGSYRRGAKDSGDVDVLITMEGKTPKQRAEAFHTYVEALKTQGYMTEVLSEGDQKCLSIVKLSKASVSRRLDLLVIPTEQFACALLYFTGSGDFNVAFRKHALSLGYTLNEHEMKPTGKKGVEVKAIPNFKHEAEIFAFLGLKYKEPNQRIGAMSVEELGENTKAKVAEVKRTRKAKKSKA